MAVFKTKTERLRVKAFSAITSDFTRVDWPIENPAIKIIITNDTDVGLLFSDDGENNKLYIPAGQSQQIDLVSASDASFFPRGTTFYVKHTVAGAPTSGGISIAVMCAPGK